MSGSEITGVAFEVNGNTFIMADGRVQIWAGKGEKNTQPDIDVGLTDLLHMLNSAARLVPAGSRQ
jgi:hypothetical protein